MGLWAGRVRCDDGFASRLHPGPQHPLAAASLPAARAFARLPPPSWLCLRAGCPEIWAHIPPLQRAMALCEGPSAGRKLLKSGMNGCICLGAVHAGDPPVVLSWCRFHLDSLETPSVPGLQSFLHQNRLLLSRVPQRLHVSA